MKETSRNTTKHHGSGKRPNRLELTLTDDEKSRLDELSEAAGMKPSQFLQKLIMTGGKVNAALTAEERKSITALSKIGTNIWEIRKEMINYGMDETTVSDIEVMYDDFAKIKEHFKSKVQK